MKEKPSPLHRSYAETSSQPFEVRYIAGIVVLLALVSLILWYLTFDL